jgi:hypothetical protein
MLLFDEGEPIVPCAWAKDIPATNAATAVRVVNVFIISLLGGIGVDTRHPGTTEGKGNGRESSRPSAQDHRYENLRLDNRDDLMRTRIDDHDLITHEDVIVTTPFRVNRDDLDR